MENLLLPRRERLFNNGGKLHFQNFYALFQGVLSTSFPSGKYHCKAKSLSKTISRLRHIIAQGNKVSLPGDASHTALLKSHCRGRQCSLLCACLHLFLHARTKVSCVGFIIWFPSGGLPRYARNDIWFQQPLSAVVFIFP